ncbi:hypothetical protein [Propionivibrio sp.]|uniref:hypothetical protein n=1 Tax=Propionivibrio sp. TaxID=2212460 RepID=UPI003BF39D75
MKPFESAKYLQCLLGFVATDPHIPAYIKTWFCTSASRRLADPSTKLDQLLGLRSRAGGRHTLYCSIPERDERIRTLAFSLALPTVKAQAEEITRKKNPENSANSRSLAAYPALYAWRKSSRKHDMVAHRYHV